MLRILFAHTNVQSRKQTLVEDFFGITANLPLARFHQVSYPYKELVGKVDQLKCDLLVIESEPSYHHVRFWTKEKLRPLYAGWNRREERGIGEERKSTHQPVGAY